MDARFVLQRVRLLLLNLVPRCHEILLHTDWRLLTAKEFVDSAEDVASSVGSTDRIFVRSDSPLKPFSGRVLDVASVTLRALDHGFYFDDASLSIVAAAARNVGREWRFVVVGTCVIAGSAYDAATRSAVSDQPDSDAWAYAQTVASSVSPPADAYILDV